MKTKRHYDGRALVEHGGIVKTAKELAVENGVSPMRAYRRFVCMGWTLEDSVTMPPRKTGSARVVGNARFVEFGGKVMSLADWGRELGMSYVCVIKRLRKYPKEIALTMPKCNNRGVCVDGTRQTYPKNKPNFTPDELKNGVRLKTANQRVRMGWTRKDAATVPIGKTCGGTHRWHSRANLTRIRDLAALGITV